MNSPTTPPPVSPWKKTLILPLIAALVATFAALAFSWPLQTMEAKDLPISVVGSEAQVAQIENRLQASGRGDTFDLIRADSREKAVEQIEAQESYGSIVFQDGATPEVLTAPAASSQVATMLNDMAGQISTPGQQEQAATAVVPYSENDPAGVGLMMSYLPAMLVSIIGGAIISLALRGVRQRLVGLTLYAVLAGAVLAFIFSVWFSAIPLGFATAWGIYSASLLATGLFIVGVGASLGKPAAGVGLGAVLTMLVGNPISGMTLPAPFIWGGLGYLGQWLVPGATNALLRTESYFPSASSSAAWTALALWILLGLGLAALGYARENKAARANQALAA